MKNIFTLLAISVSCLITTTKIYSQTSWKGTVNTSWNNASNWTNGIPGSSTNVTIGDGNFTGSYQPTVDLAASCNSLTIGGSVTSLLTATKNLVVSGNLLINTNGAITQPASSLTVKGDWINNGTYTTTNGNSKIIFGGIAQTIKGTSSTTFRDIVINAGASVTLGTNISVSGTGSSIQVKGTLDPGQSPTYNLNSTVNFKIFNLGNVKVNAATFAANYTLSGTVTLANGSQVEYSSTTVNQTISSAYTYSNLTISGTGTKSLSANLPSIYSSATKQGNIFVNSGIFDLSTFTANRGTSTVGGTFSVANGAYVKVGGSSNFPLNYKTNIFGLGSTVEYNGVNQTIAAEPYGNLVFSSQTGAAVKSLPSIDFTIEGNFSSMVGSGTSVSYTAASNILINGDVNIGPSTTFNGGSFSNTISGNWINNGNFSGGSGSVLFNGPSSTITGSGIQNFNNITFLASGITASTGTSINVSGNFSTSGSGQFTHLSGGILTMTGSAKSISGNNIILNDLSVSGSTSINTAITLNNNLSVSGSLNANNGTVIMVGNSNIISGTGSIAFGTLQITGNISTTANFSVSVLLDIEGTFVASAGTATFTNTSVLSGSVGLFNVNINGTSLQLSAASSLGISNSFNITSGILDVTSALPNTVIFNGAGAQNVNAISYNNLILSNGNTKTASGNITVNGNITISPSTTFAGGVYTHNVLRNWINNGSFNPSTGTVLFSGVNNATITGATTFYNLNINKSTATTTVSLLNNVSANTVNMIAGKMLTGPAIITITNTRTGNGIILGTITRTHAFTTGVSYAFEGPNNTINFASATGVTSITIKISLGNIDDFPDNASINREYDIAVTGTSYNATLRLHYEDAELNGNNESAMGLWNYSGTWNSIGKATNSITDNYVEQSALTNISTRWTSSEIPGVVRWNGSVSSDWNTAANWTNVSGTASTPPDTNDIAQIGTATFNNQPAITNVVNIKGITFGSAQAATLTLGSGGALTTSGNVGGNWTSNVVHTINTGSQNLTVNGDLSLSNGVNDRSINLNIGSGNVSVLGLFNQKGNASVNFVGSGSLNLGSDFAYTSGSFIPGTGTVNYNGTGEQAVAIVNYNNLVVNNPTGNASVSDGSAINIAGDLSILSGRFSITNSTVSISGNTSFAAGATLNCDGVTINAGGNWTNNGTYLSTSGTVLLNGSGTQNISAGTFNNLSINKSSGVAKLTGNSTVAGALAIQQGSLDLSTFTINRQSNGGSFSMAAGTSLFLAGSNNFPSNYTSKILNATSTVTYNGTISQSIAGVTYGNLSFNNGASNAKTQLADISVQGNLLISSGSTFNSGSYSTTLKGNWTNSGTFNSAAGTVILNGTGKTVTGNTSFNALTVNGSYTVAGGNMNYNGLLWVTTGASYTSSGTATVNGDLTNNGTLLGNGITTFSGTSVQTIRLVNALQSTNTGVINFNGNVSPVLNSNSSPQFATLNINNTGGLNPSVGGTVYVALNIGTGAKLNVDNIDYTIYGSFNNAGTVTGNGTISFTPVNSTSIALGSSGFSSDGIVNFGGTGQITLTGKPDYLNTVVISNTNSAGVSPSSDWIVDSNFVVTENAILNAGSFTYTIGGDIVSDGTLNGNSSTFITTDAAAELSASAETVFYNLTNTGSLVPQTDYYVSGGFVNKGVYDGSIGTLIMTGSSPGSIGGNATTLAQLTIQKSANAIVTQNVNLTSLSFLNIVSGVLFTSTNTITQDVGGGVLIINDSATLRIAGSNTLPAFSGYGLSQNSNVDYAGVATTQTIANSAVYGNLIISGTGNKNAYTALNILGNLSVNAGTFNTNTVPVIHSIGGNFTMATGSALSGTASKFILNGTNDQLLTLVSPLVKLTVYKPSGNVILGSDITLKDTLRFTYGNIRTNNYKVIISSTGNIAGPTQSTGWVFGNLQKYVVTGASVSRTFEIGDSSYYTPASVAFTTVSTAGNFLAKVTPNDHPLADYSGLDISKSVNRYWSLTDSGAVFASSTVTLNWVPADVDAGATTSNFKTATYNGTNWILYGVSNQLSTSISSTGCTSFGDFQVGELLSQYKWTGNAMSSDWFTNGNWTGGIPTNAMNAIIPAGLSSGKVYPVLNSGTATVKGLTIESTASLKISGATLQVSGVLGNSGTLDASNGIEMNGASAQTIAGSMFANKVIKNLIVSNSSASGLSIASTINDTLKITGTLSFGNASSILNTGDNLDLVSSAMATANVGVVGTGNIITGKAIVERYINTGTAAGQHGKSWQLLSVPVNGQSVKESWMENGASTSGYGTQASGPGGTTAGFDNYSVAPSVKYYNSGTNNWVGISSASFPVNDSRGLMIFVRGDRTVASATQSATPTILRSKGTLNVGQLPNINIPVDSFKTVGNPYASPIDFTMLTKSSQVDNKFYTWDPYLYGSYGTGGYQSFSSINNWEPVPGGTSAYPAGISNSIIQSGQAFLVHATKGTSEMRTYGEVAAAITFTEDSKVTNGGTGNFARKAERTSGASYEALKVSLFTGPGVDGLMADGNVVVFNKSYSNSVDQNDVLKLSNSGENFGIKRNGKMLSIEAHSEISAADTIFYSMSNLAKRTYQLRFAPVNLSSLATQAFLIDKFLKTETPVSLTDSSFINIAVTSDAASSASDRLMVVFRRLSALPVTITSVTATLNNKDIDVKWSVQNESGIQHYEIEKSNDGTNFNEASSVNAINSASGNYSWTDLNVSAGTYYYRIKIISVDGKVTYSQVVKVVSGTVNQQISVYPNPIQNSIIHLQLVNQQEGVYDVRLFNSAGQLIVSKKLTHAKGTSEETIACPDLAKGIYQLEVVTSGGSVKVIKVMN